MRLTADEFHARYEGDNLNIAFIGMSNIGKSYTAKRLAAEYEFNLIDIDANIQKLLGRESMEDFAAWQGQPYEPGYKNREAESIRLETKAMGDAIKRTKGNTILDTAGSVIYTSETVLESLREQFFIIHIKASAEDRRRLQKIYFEQPKPLIWGEHFEMDNSKTDAENIAASYPRLLTARSKHYAALADRQLSSEFVLGKGVTAREIFEALSAG